MSFVKHAAAILTTVFCIASAHAVDSFDPSTNLLTLESVTLGGQTYKNVAVTVSAYSQLSVGGGTPVADSFDPSTNLLTMGTVAVGGSTYTNVRVQVDSYNLLSAAGAATIGTQTPPTYTGELASYLDTLNNYRTQCGLPALAQNSRLEAATVQFGLSGGRIQSAANTSGYALPDTVGFVESDVISNSADTVAVGRSQALLAMTEPYALLTLMRPYAEIGLISTSSTKNGLLYRSANAMFGSPQSRGLISPLTFPCANTTDISPAIASSSAGSVSRIGTPGTARSLFGWFSYNGGVTTGTPIAIFAQPGDSLLLSSASVTSNGVSVLVMLWDSTRSVGVTTGQYHPASDKMLYSYEGLVLPLVALAQNTSYDVTINGTVNGVAFKKTFKFKTGASIT